MFGQFVNQVQPLRPGLMTSRMRYPLQRLIMLLPLLKRWACTLRHHDDLTLHRHFSFSSLRRSGLRTRRWWNRINLVVWVTRAFQPAIFRVTGCSARYKYQEHPHKCHGRFEGYHCRPQQPGPSWGYNWFSQCICGELFGPCWSWCKYHRLRLIRDHDSSLIYRLIKFLCLTLLKKLLMLGRRHLKDLRRVFRASVQAMEVIKTRKNPSGTWISWSAAFFCLGFDPYRCILVNVTPLHCICAFVSITFGSQSHSKRP